VPPFARPSIPAAPVAPVAPMTPMHPVAPAAEAGSRWKPAAVAGVAFGAAAVLNFGTIPGVVVSHWVPLVLLASGCLAALRWKRAGVRRELRNQASAKIAEFGGGVYGAMAMATLLYLEATDLVSDVASAGSLTKFIGALDVGWLVEQVMESVGFAIRAGLWPWHWLSDYGMQTVLIAGGAAVGLDALIRAVSPRYRARREVPAAAAPS
jgi:hypothetical protein